ncbi:MAG: aromatic ring-hydroxylating oxygenase subunit alpha [Dongiaceae bacterium]
MQESEVLLRQLVELARAPRENSTPNQPGMYRSPEIYALEQKEIFAKEWLCAGRALDVPKPGDYLTFSIGDQPVFSIRERDGKVRSFSNVCLHRMMRLLDGQGNCSRIVCPYHAWTYDLDGQLIGARHMNKTPGFDVKDFRLPEVRTEIWHGWIYITLNPAAPSVASQLRALHDVVDPYGMADYVPMITQDHVWNTNWKLLTENFMEGYHLPVAHRRTVGAWFPADQTEFPDQVFDAFTYQTFIKTEDARYGRAHPSNTRLEGRWRHTTVMPTIYPTHMIVLAPDHLWYLSLRPKAIGQVHLKFGVAIAPEVVAAQNDMDGFKRDLLEFFDRVNEEDRLVVEGIYEGSGAPLARPGRLSWLEREIHDFIGYLARRLAGWQSEATASDKLRVAS